MDAAPPNLEAALRLIVGRGGAAAPLSANNRPGAAAHHSAPRTSSRGAPSGTGRYVVDNALERTEEAKDPDADLYSKLDPLGFESPAERERYERRILLPYFCDPIAIATCMPFWIAPVSALRYVWMFASYLVVAVLLVVFFFVTHPQHLETCCYESSDPNKHLLGPCDDPKSPIHDEPLYPDGARAHCSAFSTADLVLIWLSVGIGLQALVVYVATIFAYEHTIFETTDHGKLGLFFCLPVPFFFALPARQTHQPRHYITAQVVLTCIWVLCIVFFAEFSHPAHRMWGCYGTSPSIYRLNYGPCTDPDAAINTSKKALRIEPNVLSRADIGFIVSAGVFFVLCVIWGAYLTQRSITAVTDRQHRSFGAMYRNYVARLKEA